MLDAADFEDEVELDAIIARVIDSARQPTDNPDKLATVVRECKRLFDLGCGFGGRGMRQMYDYVLDKCEWIPAASLPPQSAGDGSTAHVASGAPEPPQLQDDVLYTPTEVAGYLHCTAHHVRDVFRDLDGVVKINEPARRGYHEYVVMRIPGVLVRQFVNGKASKKKKAK